MKGDAMDELLQGLVAVLERGIVIEPYGENWTARTSAIRIRLADDPATPTIETAEGKKGLTW